MLVWLQYNTFTFELHMTTGEKLQWVACDAVQKSLVPSSFPVLRVLMAVSAKLESSTTIDVQ